MSLISGLINRVGLRISYSKVFNSVYFFYRLLFCKRFINIKLENKSYIIFNLSFSIEYWLVSCILWISMKLFRSENLYLGFSESSISIVLSRSRITILSTEVPISKHFYKMIFKSLAALMIAKKRTKKIVSF